jgi:hypothetical protein
MAYHEKYIKYKNKYIQETYKLKLLNNIVNHFIQSGAGPVDNSTDVSKANDEDVSGSKAEVVPENLSYTMYNLESTINYILKKYNKMDNIKITKNKYFVILYGPPSSGKTLAKKIGCYLIKKYMEEELKENEILDTFIDSNIDDLIYDKEIEDTNDNNVKKRVQQILLDQLTKYKEQAKIQNDITKDNIDNSQSIKDFINFCEKFYSRENKPDSLSDLMIFLGSYLKKNIFFETGSGSLYYANTIMNILKLYNYIPIIVYPYVDNIDLLYERAIKRGNKEGRFIARTSIESMSNSSVNNYNKLFDSNSQDDIINEFKKNKNLLICRYNGKTNNYEYYNNLDFQKIDTDIYDLYIQKIVLKK